ncbi:efflux RND transporter periplasmic adaptor subunit [Vibrio fluvialis]|uniref:efflux RND transporter periplasmic adaptor subunit n=1 Tax=Vibrio fluvialis TaxID=676 RepID=UPI0028DD5D83|nr:TolC family protein [Vibrio fluvialis]MDT8867686.1 TolC family protein [Vibrio fluvialis]MDT8875043.1 TolC family protein [Vibrio fluvialis]
MARYTWKQRSLFIPPLLLGGVLLFLAPSMKAVPPATEEATGSKVVRVITAKPMDISPTAVGYGFTRPTSEWIAQAEVEGRVVWVAKDFEAGMLIAKGTPLIRLDSAQYQLNITKLEAELDVSRLKSQTLGETIKIAEQNYRLQQQEFARTERLMKTGHISQTERDRAQRELLSNQQQLQGLKNELAITQAEQQVLNAELSIARRDLSLTKISAPFDLRVTEKLVDLADFVIKGKTLLTGDATDAVEIQAQFPLGKMRPLRRNTPYTVADKQPHSDLTAQVELNIDDKAIIWQGDVQRSGGKIDAQSQSQSIIVQVNNPYQQAKPGQRPPLVRDTFVKVTLIAPPLKAQLVVPVTALHDNTLYLIKDGKLAIQPVTVDFFHNQLAVIKSGLSSGDVVVVSQLHPAVKGMPLKPQPDKTLVQWIKQQAGGSL